MLALCKAINLSNTAPAFGFTFISCTPRLTLSFNARAEWKSRIHCCSLGRNPNGRVCQIEAAGTEVLFEQVFLINSAGRKFDKTKMINNFAKVI
jgi:hypothetical protein